MELRTYQWDTIEKLRRSLAGGKRRPVVQAPTGSGKTEVAASIVRMAREKGKRVIFTVPALELIDQTVERFARHGILEVGVMQAAHELTDRDQPVQVCSVQTLNRRDIPKSIWSSWMSAMSRSSSTSGGWRCPIGRTFHSSA